MPREMNIREIGEVYELSRDQWEGHSARISKDPSLLEEVKKYTWTYTAGEHPYLRCSKLGMTLHKFVLSHVYGIDNLEKMLEGGHIIEHLNNNGLDCTYENLHILLDDMNKAKAFTIDKKTKETEDFSAPLPYILDVYYLHMEKCFQMQIFFNEDIITRIKDNASAEFVFCKYKSFENLYLDWIYLLNSRPDRSFELLKLHADSIKIQPRPYLELSQEEKESQFILRNGEFYLNLDFGQNTGLAHTSLRNIDL